MTRQSSLPMSRFLLALCLFLFAATALANSAVAGGDPAGNGVKPGKAATVSAQDNDAAVSGAAPAAPARSAPRTASPRWHSLLPGMIR